jgi:hypothetical protein
MPGLVWYPRAGVQEARASYGRIRVHKGAGRLHGIVIRTCKDYQVCEKCLLSRLKGGEVKALEAAGVAVMTVNIYIP